MPVSLMCSITSIGITIGIPSPVRQLVLREQRLCFTFFGSQFRFSSLELPPARSVNPKQASLPLPRVLDKTVLVPTPLMNKSRLENLLESKTVSLKVRRGEAGGSTPLGPLMLT